MVQSPKKLHTTYIIMYYVVTTYIIYLQQTLLEQGEMKWKCFKF